MVPPSIRATLDRLPDDALVLDVGGWAEADPRADWVLDIGSFETRNYYAHTLGAAAPTLPERFTSATWVQRDICSSEPWPFEDGMFAYAICTHTLEDVRDPIRVCQELVRVSRAGYLETPSAVTELTRGIQSRAWCGWSHHHWLAQREGDGLVFFAKPHHVHAQTWPSVRSPRFLTEEARRPLGFEWEGPFPVRQEVIVDGDEADAYLRGVIRAAARPDPVGASLVAARSLVAAGGERLRRALRG